MINKEEILKNKSYWENMSNLELNDFKLKIFNYYRENGFPYYPTNAKYRIDEFNTLLKYDYSNIIEDNIIKQTMHGLGLAWSYFPHAFDVPCNNKRTPLEVFNDDKLFMKVIDKRLKMGTYISDSGIIKMLKMYTNTQAVSNFRPTAAAAIYDKYAPDGVVWDMSGGWGGRMLGAMISSVKMYLCTEPAEKTYMGLNELHNDFGSISKTQILTHKMGSEIFYPPPEKFDLCFTSPPYFDLEKYSDEDTQSYKKYSNKNEWINGFLTKTFTNCYQALKPNKYMLINIADPKKNNDVSLEEATIKKAKVCGFNHVDTLKLTLSNPNMKNRQTAFKYEPIFVFQK